MYTEWLIRLARCWEKICFFEREQTIKIRCQKSHTGGTLTQERLMGCMLQMTFLEQQIFNFQMT